MDPNVFYPISQKSCPSKNARVFHESPGQVRGAEV